MEECTLQPEFKLNKPQFEFNACTKAFKCFVGGYRSGKTFVLCVEAFIKCLEYPGIDMAYFAPTYPLIKTIFWPTIEEVGEMFGFTVEIKRADKEVFLYYDGALYSKIICRSMDNPSAIVGFQVNHAMIDEIDCMKKEKADDAWKKIVARLSSEGFDEHEYTDAEGIEYMIDAMNSNTASFATTPEGYNWVYEFFVRQIRDKPDLAKYYELIKAKTTDNAKNLPADYIDKLYETYPANLVEAYVNGEFVNLTSGTIYSMFDRSRNCTDIEENGEEELHIGMDFNVDQMAAVVHVKRGDKAYAIDEFFGANDTPDIIKQIKNKYPSRSIIVYPDASGSNRTTKNAGTSDIKLLKQAGFRVIVNKKNPGVRDRINAVNSAFFNAKEEVRYFVNVNKCPFYTECLEQQTYDKGEPDKKGGKDHMNDAGGYFVVKVFPAEKPRTKTRFKKIRMA